MVQSPYVNGKQLVNDHDTVIDAISCFPEITASAADASKILDFRDNFAKARTSTNDEEMTNDEARMTKK
jgi:hypothetical protein